MQHYNVSKSVCWNQIVEADEYRYIFNLVRVVTHTVYYDVYCSRRTPNATLQRQ